MKFDKWVARLPKEITGDSLWKMEAYRLALFATEIGWHDVTELMKERRTQGSADQLYRALGSVSANLAEGYSHPTGKSRAQYYQYALGSAREARDWYCKSHHVLKDEVVQHRISLLTQITKLLLTMVPQQRGKTLVLREAQAAYRIDPDIPLEQMLLPCSHPGSLFIFHNDTKFALYQGLNRQSRRDRYSQHARLQGTWHQNGRGLF